MRFAVRRFSKAIVIGALGCAAAVLIACGDTNGLLSGGSASSLDRALDGVSAACSRGMVGDAQASAEQVQREVDKLSPREVDRRLIRQLREGASTIQQLVPETCREVTSTAETQTEVQTTPQTTPTTPSTTPQTTPETTPTTPDNGGGTTTTPGNGGGGTTTPDNGGGSSNGGGQGGGTDHLPDANQGNPGGALAPGQGGSTP